MNIEQEIKGRIERALNPQHLEVVNESHKHLGHAGDDGSGQTHFKLIVVSVAFAGCSRIQRQQQINTIILDLFDKGLHAVSMKLHDPSEFKS